jgi:hypothetical protein
MNVCAMGAVALLCEHWSRRWAIPRAVAIGLLLTLDTFYKQVTAPLAVLLVVSHWVEPPAGVSRGKALLHGLVMAMTAALCWGAYLMWLRHDGTFAAFWEANFDFNRAYSKAAGSFGIFANLLGGITSPPSNGHWTLFWIVPLYLLSVALLCAAGNGISRRAKWLLASTFAGSFFAMAAPGNYFPHYFQLLLPGLCVSVAVLRQARWDYLRVNIGKGRETILIIVGAFFFIDAGRFFAYPVEQWPVLKYDTQDDVNALALAGVLDRELQANETFYEWGAEPQLYFYSKRRPVTAILSDMVLSFPGYQGPWSERMVSDTVEQLRRAQPELAVIRRLKLPIPKPLQKWLAANYLTMVPVNNPSFFVLARQGGRVEASLRKQQPTTKSSASKPAAP